MRSQRYGQVRAVPFGTTTALASGEAARVALRSAAEGPGAPHEYRARVVGEPRERRGGAGPLRRDADGPGGRLREYRVRAPRI
jgi:hypothetical protein